MEGHDLLRFGGPEKGRFFGEKIFAGAKLEVCVDWTVDKSVAERNCRGTRAPLVSQESTSIPIPQDVQLPLSLRITFPRRNEAPGKSKKLFPARSELILHRGIRPKSPERGSSP